MNTLSWDDYLKYEPVRAAHGRLLELAGRGQTTRSLVLLPLDTSGGARRAIYKPEADGHHFHLDPNGENPAYSLVHELVHAILLEEGYDVLWFPCALSLDFHECVRLILRNELQHPEVFRRMAEYGLDMAVQSPTWDEELQNSVREMKGTSDNPQFRLYHLPRLVPWFFMGEAATPYLEQYREFDQVLYAAAADAYRQAADVGFSTPEDNRESLRRIHACWAHYCREHSEVIGSDLVRRVETTRLKSAAPDGWWPTGEGA